MNLAKRIVWMRMLQQAARIVDDPMASYRAWMTVAVVCGSITIVASSATAQKRYSPGASDTEIKIGNIAPYSDQCRLRASTAKPSGPISTR